MRLSEMAGGKKVRGAGGVHALLPHHLRRAVAARARHLPALPPADGMKFIFVGGARDGCRFDNRERRPLHARRHLERRLLHAGRVWGGPEDDGANDGWEHGLIKSEGFFCKILTYDDR